MSRYLGLVLLLALAGCGQQAGGQPVGTQPPEASVAGPVVEIRATRDGISSCGNACVVRVNGEHFVLTAWHVINEGGELTLYSGGQRLNVTFGDVRHRDDAAVIPLSGYTGQAIEASFTMPEAGDRIEVSGLQQGKAVILIGTISQISVRSDAPLTLGMSGAPVVVGGRVVGVSTSISTVTNADGRSNSGASHIALASIKGLF